jgi:hypothetical protein
MDCQEVPEMQPSNYSDVPACSDMNGGVSCATCQLGVTIQTLSHVYSILIQWLPRMTLIFCKKNARTAIKFFTGILPSFFDGTEHSHSLCRRPPTGRDPLMHGSASALDGGLMPDVVSPNVAAPAGTQMVAAPVGLLKTAGVSPNTTAPAPSPLQMAAALDALQMAAALMNSL